jgi:hypothetical protein
MFLNAFALLNSSLLILEKDEKIENGEIVSIVLE